MEHDGSDRTDRSTGVADSEVVIAHLDVRGSARPLRTSALGLIAAVIVEPLLIAATPLSHLWFGTVTGLSEDLVRLARNGLWFAPLPGMSALQSRLRGIGVHSRRTRSVTDATLIDSVLPAGILWIGIE
jgi:hypothetical protein